MRLSKYTASASALLIMVVMIMVLLSASWAQTTEGGIVGMVQDENGAVITFSYIGENKD
jgi:hypothetical protein